MHFFRDCGVGSVPVRQPGRSPCTSCTLRFSARCFLALIAMDGLYACFTGAQKQVTKKLLFLDVPLVTRCVVATAAKHSMGDGPILLVFKCLSP
jgi:hypothetical protein